MESKKLYIVISQTGSIVSKFIRIVTRDRYNHVSVTLDKELNTMYSFGRVHTYNPFIGGFVKESVNNGSFKRFIRNTVAVIMELEVTPEQHKAVACDLANMYTHRTEYHYNYKGLFLAMFGKVRHKIHTFYCSEFLQKLLERHGIIEPKNERSVIKPMDFLAIPDGKILFEGRLRDFCRKRKKKIFKKKTDK